MCRSMSSSAYFQVRISLRRCERLLCTRCALLCFARFDSIVCMCTHDLIHHRCQCFTSIEYNYRLQVAVVFVVVVVASDSGFHSSFCSRIEQQKFIDHIQFTSSFWCGRKTGKIFMIIYLLPNGSESGNEHTTTHSAARGAEIETERI